MILQRRIRSFEILYSLSKHAIAAVNVVFHLQHLMPVALCWWAKK